MDWKALKEEYSQTREMLDTLTPLDSDIDCFSEVGYAKWGAVPYEATMFEELLVALASGWLKKWPEEIYKAETPGARRNILEAFMYGKAKRLGRSDG